MGNPDALQWASLVAVPLVGTFLAFFGQRISSRIKSVESSAQEAAKNVRPNGTGHSTLTAISEDILMHMGELRGEMKDVRKDLDDINSSLGKHLKDDRQAFDTITAALKKLDLTDD